MEHQHIVEACKKAFTGYELNDKAELIALLSDDIVFEFTDSLPYGGTFRGKEEFLAFWRHVYSLWEYFNYDARTILPSGDHVVVQVIARAKAFTGYSLENEHAFVFQVRDGKIAHARLYADTARGRDCLEGREPRRHPKVLLD